MKKLALHWKILIGMALGIIAGLLMSNFGAVRFSANWIAPFGKIFINLLKVIAVPLVFASLISGVSNLKDISRLSRIGAKTIAVYMVTTVLAVSLGLIIVNVVRPGNYFSPEKKEQFMAKFAEKSAGKQSDAAKVKEQGPLQFLENMVPDNVVGAATSNTNMLQVIVFAILFGVALIQVPADKSEPVRAFFEGFNDIIIKIVEMIMLIAPYGVFALMASLITDFAGDNPAEALELFGALGMYSFSVVLGLAIMGIGVYPLIIKVFAKYDLKRFMQGIAPAQLLAFSTSSSAATLPVTMEQVEKELGVPEEISSFVLPVGATINMDGTSLYQAVAAVFIAQAFGMDLSLGAQLGIITTATLASVGSAAVPGAGMVMLVIVLEQANIPAEGLALIVAVDRFLDMCRTVVNVTGDAAVTVFIAGTEGVLKKD